MIYAPQKPKNAMACWCAEDKDKHTCVCGYSKKHRDATCSGCAKIDPMGEANQAAIAKSWSERWGG